MKKTFLAAMMLAMLCVFAVHAEENSPEKSEEQTDLTAFYLRPGVSFTYFSINGIEYYNYFDPSYAPEIVEVITVDRDLYKVVYAEPLNKAGALRYVTLYLKIADLVAIGAHRANVLYAGIVVTGNPNCIELAGIKKD